MNSNKKRGIAEGISEKFDIPGEGVAGQTRLTLTGTRRVHIENHRGVIEYNETLISVNCGDIIISITGENLELQSMNAQELLIRGDVRAINIS